MRYGPDRKAETHKGIVKDASRHLRRAGLRGSGVARVMRASGLTHGGFYKHFRSKSDLIVEALAEAFRQRGDEMSRAVANAPASEGWRAIVNWYLSEEHCAHPETGCPMAALAPELARIDTNVKKRIAEILRTYRAGLLPLMPGKRPVEREKGVFRNRARNVGHSSSRPL
jgi:TetR/AcrR family transcriptional repressor of nem operon